MSAVEQLSLRLESGGGPLILRIKANSHVRRAERDWTREGHAYTSSNGWTVRRAHIGSCATGWAAFAPDGCPEWWGADAVIAMERAEGNP